jgi:hypothetical protein
MQRSAKGFRKSSTWGLSQTIYEEAGSRIEKAAQDFFRLGRHIGVIESRRHQLQPAVTRRLIDLKGSVAHSQARMTALLDIVLRAAEAKDQKSAQTVFGSGKIAPAIHGAKNVIVWNLPVKRGNEFAKAFFADGRVYVLLFHDFDANRMGKGQETNCRAAWEAAAARGLPH